MDAENIPLDADASLTDLPVPDALSTQLSTEISQATSRWAQAPIRRTLPAEAIERTLWQRHVRALVTQVVLLALDALAINLAFLFAYYLRFGVLAGVRFTTVFISEPLNSFRPLEWQLTAVVLAAFWFKGLYRLRLGSGWFKQLWAILGATLLAFAIYSAFEYIVGKTNIDLETRSRSLVLLTWIGIAVGVSLARLLVVAGVRLLYRWNVGLTNLLVVGSGRLGKLMLQQVAANPGQGYRVVGFLHDQDGPPTDFGRFHVLGTMRDLDRVIREQSVGEVLIALPSHQHHLIMRTMRHCERLGANYRLVPHLYELSLSRIEVDEISGIPLIGMRRALTSTLQYRAKRLIDILGAGLLLAFSAPVWLATALVVWLDSPGPILLRQERVGQHGMPFQCFKFRSMHVDAARLEPYLLSAIGERGKFKLTNDPRRTRVGAFIRRMSIDELPQLINVLRGEMSLVGPRPPLPSEYARYEDWEKARLEMPPGITGLWQVRGRADLDFNEMVLMDLYYIEHWSLAMDLQILLQTVPAVLARRGAY